MRIEAARPLALASVLAVSLVAVSCSQSRQAGPVPSKAVAVSPDERKLARDARLEIEVDRKEEIRERIAASGKLARDLGGYVALERADGILLRIPDAKLEEAIEATGKLGTVDLREVTARDVTEEWVDTGIRIANARRLQERLRDLLARASSVEDVLAVEKELARVTTELETLEGRMRLLDNQVAFSSLDVRFREPVKPGPVGWVFVGVYRAVRWLFVRNA